MLVNINQQVFNSLDDASLIWACIEPTIQKIRGKNFTVKTDEYAQLSKGQKALLMFQVMYGHTSKGIMEFYCLVPYLPSKAGIWKELMKGMQLFGDSSMLQLLSQMEGDYNALEEKCRNENIDRIDACINKLDESSELLLSITQHNKKFRETLPTTFKLIGEYIRNNPNEFVMFQE